MPPTLANGKICYVEIPALDPRRSAEFYASVFGWNIRRRGDGATAFDDATGEVSGSFVTGRNPQAEPGFLLYVMVADAAATLEKIVAGGGAIVQPLHAGSPEIVARFRDPAGNLVGIYQEKALADRRGRPE
jgi:predicted enzyme related to lactoylglutathione lyase